MSNDYSAAAFGKKRPFLPGLIREYELLARNDQFPERARSVLKLIGKAFSWVSSDKRHSACYGAWTWDDGGALLTRFIDEGNDDVGRPHLLRVDGVYLPNAATIEALAAFLTPSAWPLESIGGELGTMRVTPADSHSECSEERRYSFPFGNDASSPVAGTIVGSPRSYFMKLGQKESVGTGPPTPDKPAPTPPPPKPPRPPSPPGRPVRGKTLSPMLTSLAKSLPIVASLMIVWWWGEQKSSQILGRLDGLSRVIKEVQRDSATMQQEMTSLSSQLEDSKSALKQDLKDSQAATEASLKSEYEGLRRQIDVLQESLKSKPRQPQSTTEFNN